MDEDIIAIFMFGLIVLIPVAGFTARIALRPFIDRILKIAEARQSTEEVRLLERRLSLLEQEFHTMSRQLQDVTDQQEFYARLSNSEP